MGSPWHSQLVVAMDGGEFEVSVTAADCAMPIGRFLHAVTGTEPRHVTVEGFPIDNDSSIAEAGLRRGSRVAIGDRPSGEPVVSLVGLSGSEAGTVRRLPPGAHLVAPEEQSSSGDVGVQVRGTQGGAACLYVDVDGTAHLDPRRQEVTVDGERIREVTSLTGGPQLRVAGRSYAVGPVQPRAGRLGTVAFNRPPRAEYPVSLPALVAPAAPPAAQQPMRFGWGALVIPILIGGLMAFLWSPMMAIFAVFSPAMMLANWYEDRRRARRSSAESAAGVAVAMEDFERRCDALFAAARAMAWRAAPSPREMTERICLGDTRMWQRRHHHPDFLDLAIGVGTVDFRPTVTPPQNERAPRANALLEERTELVDVPVTVELGAGRVLGIAGHRRRQLEMARWLLIAAAAHHGPSDLAIAIVTDHPDEWDCIKWLPHLQLAGDRSRLAVVAPGEAADELLLPLLESGGSDPAAALRDRPVGPAVLLLVDVLDVTTAAAASLRRALAGDGARRRSGIALARAVEELPSSCADIVRVDAVGNASLERPSRAERIGPISSWRLASAVARRLARTIGGYHDPDLQVGGGDLPDVVHLLDLLGLADRTPDAVLRRWSGAGQAPRCAAAIGASVDGPVEVDWVEDGPHALLAGTTGSGKSELLRSLVASLAASVDPEHLNLVLIDYKGGSAFDACAGLPHTVGMVTDLDGHLAERALTCLEAELRYREERLREVAAADIAAYQAGGHEEPLPRLLVVIDEFAALAKELPDFMAALVDIAQRGRSLGVHLLLATQRPNGVINDNIRANTNLRVSLRVQDVADSVDVIGCTDAAALSRARPGRGYLRRGPGEVVAFQSALVTGRSAAPDGAVSVSPFQLNAPPLPGGGGDDLREQRSDLETLVEMISEAARKAGMRQPRLPWPAPLSAEIRFSRPPVMEQSGEVTLGVADEPHRQRQHPFTWATDTNLFIYGVQGAGTSTALRTAVLAACTAATADQLHVYVLDFDDQASVVLEPLPHVGAVIGAGDRDRQIRLLRYLQEEVAARRERAADSVAVRREPRIVVAVDNYAGFRAAYDDPADMATKEALGRLVADGPGVGIVVVATAKQPIDIPTTVASLVPTKLVLQLADRYEYSGLGVALNEPPELPGRAFEAGTSTEIQLMISGAADVAELAAACPRPDPAQAPWAIELLPLEVKVADVAAGARVFDLEWWVPVAIGDDRLEPVGWSLREGDHVLVTGPARSGKSTALATVAAVLRSARPEIRITAVAPHRSVLTECADVDLLLRDPAELVTALAACDPDTPHAVLIDDAEDIEDSTGVWASLIADRHPHRHVFAAGAADILRSAYGHWTQGVRRSRLGLALKPNLSGDGDLWQTSLPRHGPAFFAAGRGYLIGEGRVELVQVGWQ